LKTTFLTALAVVSLLSAPCLYASDPPPAAQTNAAIHGKILELGSSEGLANAMVRPVGTTRSAISDDRGGYRIAVEPGEVALRYTAPGHAPRVKNLQLKPGQVMELNVSLDRVDFAAAAVVVRSRKDKPQVLTTSLSRKEIKKIPGASGDAVKAVQNLPGIAVADDFSSQLSVQGGGPADNQYLLDNIPWPYPFHFGGALSTVNADLLSSVDLHSAGFGSRWGSGMGAVLEAKTRTPAKDRLRASFDISMINSQALFEGPLGIGDASLALSGRRSYLDLFFGKQFSGTFTAFPYFWDLAGSLEFSLGRQNRFRALALASDDVLGYSMKPEDAPDPSLAGEFRLENRAVTGGLSWVNTAWPGITSTLTPYAYQTLDAQRLGTGYDVHDQMTVYGIKEEVEWKAGAWLGVRHDVTLGGGVELRDYRTRVFAFRNNERGVPTDPTSTTVTARALNRNAFIQDRMQLHPALALTAGVHYTKDERVARDAVLPRVSLEWQCTPRTAWKAAWGRYAQFPAGLETNPEFGNPGLSPNLAEHSVISLENRLTREFSGRISAYYKNYHNLVVKDPATQEVANQGIGTAKGVEVLLRADVGERFFGWVSYAFSRSERQDPGGAWSRYQYDQPHILTLVANYSMTPAWSLGVKLHHNSGILVKSLQSRYQDGSGIWRPVFSDTYDQRLDDYLRLDLRTDYSWRFEGWRLNVFAEILNVLNRPNPAGIQYSGDYSESHAIHNLPRIPYVGLEAQF